MKWFKISVLVLSLSLITSLSSAQAVGPIVTKNCMFDWPVIGVDSAGQPITTGPVSYEIWVAVGNLTVPPAGTVPKATSVGNSIPGMCVDLVAGQQYTGWVGGVITGAQVIKGALGAPAPFTIAVPTQTPGAPGTLTISK